MLSSLLILAQALSVPHPVNIHVVIDGFEKTHNTTLSIPQNTTSSFSPDEQLSIKMETLQDYKNEQVVIAEIKGPVLVSPKCIQKVEEKCVSSLLLGTAKKDFFLYPGKNDINFGAYEIEIVVEHNKEK